LIFLVVLVLVVGLAIVLVVAVAKDPGSTPTEVALAYEHAWDDLDFEVVYKLSGPELHEGVQKAQFVDAKRAAYPGGRFGHRVAEAVPESVAAAGDSAVVVTRLSLHDGSVVHNELRLMRRSRVWEVVAYELRPTPAA
jgi:hypothetical protein